MADDRKITIVLQAQDGSSDGDDADSEGKETPEQEYQRKHKKAVYDVIKKGVGYAYAEISAQVSYDVGKYINLSEDYKTAMLQTNASQTVSVIKSMVGSTLSWAKLGTAVAGPAGTAVGAVAGLTLGAASEAMNLIRQYDSQNMGLAISDKASQYASSRLGLVDGGRGTQN